MPRRLLAVATLLIVCLTADAGPRGRRRSAQSEGPAAKFDYYLLALSWAPDFCAFGPGQKDPRECGKGRRLGGFVVHGLWPQLENDRGPQRCGPARPVSQTIINATLPYIPVDSLIQHEWSGHGTCSGLSAANYFAALRKARDSVKVPRNLIEPNQEQRLSPAQIEAEFAAANPGFPKEAFRATCQNRALQEVRICFTKDLKARACGPAAGSCPLNSLAVLPVQ